VAALGLLQVGVDELGLDRLDVGERVDAALGMDDRVVVMGAPATSPAMSWKSIVSGTISDAPTSLATASSRSSATATTATFGSIVVKG
jgi:hypothetical protein